MHRPQFQSRSLQARALPWPALRCKLLRLGRPDLLQAAQAQCQLSRLLAGRLVRATIDRALARHAGDYGQVERVRSRRSGRVVFIELALRFDPSLSIAEVNRRIDAMKQSLGREIEHADISVLALAEQLSSP